MSKHKSETEAERYARFTADRAAQAKIDDEKQRRIDQEVDQQIRDRMLNTPIPEL